ncbi:MAG: hypothetical protein LBC14_08810 [Desulfovibrio sp.]|jgi:hypothetical protein|nr:hypothetical protein [Desulfovibrio sp.]
MYAVSVISCALDTSVKTILPYLEKSINLRYVTTKGANLPYGKNPLSPKNDVIFHMVFGEHKNVLTGFLQAVLDLPAEEYEDIKIVD